jgi:hypothetical protein
MTDSTLLDDVERQLSRALRVKAEQVVVADEPFDPDAGTPLHVVPLTRDRTPGRRALAAAAAAVVVVGLGAAAVQIARQARVPGSPTVAMAAARYTVREDGPAGFVPATLPPGWALRDMNVGATTSPGYGARWQLFGSAGSPMAQGVVVGTVRNEEHRVIEGATGTVQGRPAEVGPAPDPTAPPGAIQAVWIDGGIVHEAIAVGMDDAELGAFLDALVPRDDPATGFDAPGGTPLPEVARAVVEDSYTTSVVYADPAGGTVTLTATSSDRYGGLLHRLAGEPAPDGYVRHGTSGGDPASAFVSVARSDGWTVDVAGSGLATAAQDPAILDGILASAAPVTTRQLVDLGVAQPVTATYAADGWTVELHGTPSVAVALCLTPEAGGTPSCTTAEDASPWGLAAGSALVDGRWLVATVSDREPATIRTAALDPARTIDREDLTPADRPGTPAVQVVTVPADAEAVEVTVPTVGGQAVGFVYGRPGG